MKDHQIEKIFKAYYGFMLVAIVLAVGFIGVLQPYMADDYKFFNLAMPNKSPAQFLASLYFQWTGRMQGAFFLWLEMQNALARLTIKALHGPVLLGTAYLILTLAFRRRPRIFGKDCLAFLLSVGSLWFGLPFLSEVVFWNSGASFYLLPVFLGLLFLVPYNKQLEFNKQERGFDKDITSYDTKTRRLFNVAMCLLGLWVGFSQEQLVIGISLFLLFFWVFQFKKKKEGCKTPSWLIYGTAGFILGSATLIAAPGNYARLSLVNGTDFYKALTVFLGYLFFVVIANAWRDWWPWIVGIGLLAMSMTKERAVKIEDRNFVLLWIFTGLATLIPLLFLSSFVVDRAAYFAFIFWNIALFSILKNRYFTTEFGTSPKIYILVAALLVNMIFIDGALGVKTAQAISKEVYWREGIIAAAKQKGETSIVLPPFSTKFRRTTFISDITTDPEHWINKSVAEYFEVESIRLSAKNEDYKDVKSAELAQLLRSIFQKKYKSTN